MEGLLWDSIFKVYCNYLYIIYTHVYHTLNFELWISGEKRILVYNYFSEFTTVKFNIFIGLFYYLKNKNLYSLRYIFKHKIYIYDECCGKNKLTLEETKL